MTVSLLRPITARYLKLLPRSYTGRMCMRIELRGNSHGKEPGEPCAYYGLGGHEKRPLSFRKWEHHALLISHARPRVLPPASFFCARQVYVISGHICSACRQAARVYEKFPGGSWFQTNVCVSGGQTEVSGLLLPNQSALSLMRAVVLTSGHMTPAVLIARDVTAHFKYIKKTHRFTPDYICSLDLMMMVAPIERLWR